jgi:hypothetical protein
MTRPEFLAALAQFKGQFQLDVHGRIRLITPDYTRYATACPGAVVLDSCRATWSAFPLSGAIDSMDLLRDPLFYDVMVAADRSPIAARRAALRQEYDNSLRADLLAVLGLEEVAA